MRDTNLSPKRPRDGTYHFSTSSIYRNESYDPLMMQEILGNGVFNWIAMCPAHFQFWWKKVSVAIGARGKQSYLIK